MNELPVTGSLIPYPCGIRGKYQYGKKTSGILDQLVLLELDISQRRSFRNITWIWKKTANTDKLEDTKKYRCLNSWEFTLTCFFFIPIHSYLICIVSSLSVVLKVFSIFAVVQHIFWYPLVDAISSLCRYKCYLINSMELDLKPLVGIICTSWPGSPFASSCLIEESGLVCSMICVPLRRGTYSTVCDCTVLHTECAMTVLTS